MKKHKPPPPCKPWDCPSKGCGRHGARGFDRKDHMENHLRNDHGWNKSTEEFTKGSRQSVMNSTIDGNTTLQSKNDSAEDGQKFTMQSPNPQTQDLKPCSIDKDLPLDPRLLYSKPIDDAISKDIDEMGSKLRPQPVTAVASAPSDWSLSEKQTFYELTKRFGTDFQAVADIMKTRTPKMVGVPD